MRFNSLRAFRYVMETGTVVAAAGRLNLSQPAVSRLISGIENELNVALFMRQGRRLVPTAEGIELFQQTQGLLAAIDHLPVIARSIRDTARSQLRIISMPRLAHSVALPAIAALQAKDPEIRCELAIQERSGMEQDAVGLNFDLGLAVLPFEMPAVNVTRLVASPIYAVVSRRHALARRKRIAFREVAEVPVIALPAGTRDRREMEAQFNSHAMQPRIQVTVPTVEAAATLAATSEAVTFADKLSISALSHLGLAVIPMEPTWHMAFGLFRPAYRQMSPSVSELIDAIFQRLDRIGVLPDINTEELKARVR
jgi:DNA-binding transcriptional LysR family regulator